MAGLFLVLLLWLSPTQMGCLYVQEARLVPSVVYAADRITWMAKNQLALLRNVTQGWILPESNNTAPLYYYFTCQPLLDFYVYKIWNLQASGTFAIAVINTPTRFIRFNRSEPKGCQAIQKEYLWVNQLFLPQADAVYFSNDLNQILAYTISNQTWTSLQFNASGTGQWQQVALLPLESNIGYQEYFTSKIKPWSNSQIYIFKGLQVIKISLADLKITGTGDNLFFQCLLHKAQTLLVFLNFKIYFARFSNESRTYNTLQQVPLEPASTGQVMSYSVNQNSFLMQANSSLFFRYKVQYVQSESKYSVEITQILTRGCDKLVPNQDYSRLACTHSYDAITVFSWDDNCKNYCFDQLFQPNFTKCCNTSNYITIDSSSTTTLEPQPVKPVETITNGLRTSSSDLAVTAVVLSASILVVLILATVILVLMLTYLKRQDGFNPLPRTTQKIQEEPGVQLQEATPCSASHILQ